MKKMSISAVALLLIAACALNTGNQKPTPPADSVVVTQTVEVPVPAGKPVKVSKKLTRDCDVVVFVPTGDVLKDAVDLALARKKALEECNERMRKIRAKHGQ